MTQPDNASARKTLSTRLGTSPKTLHRKAMAKAAAAPVPEGESLEELFPASPVSADLAPASDNAAPLAIDTAMPDQTTQQADDDSAAAADGVAASADQAAAAPAVDIIESSAAAALAAGPAATPPSAVVEGHAAPVAPAMSGPVAAWSDQDERAFQAMSARRKAAGFQRRGRDVSLQQISIGAIAPNAGTINSAIFELVKAHGPIRRGKLLDLMATPAFSHPKAKGADRAWSQGYVQGTLAGGFLQIRNDDDPSASFRPTESVQSESVK